MGTYSFNVHIKSEDIYEDIAKDVDSNYELERPVSKGKKAKKLLA